MELFFIGVDGKKAVSSRETREQIERVRGLECLLENDGKRMTWDDLDNNKALFQKIINDKRIRVDMNNILNTRPNCCVISVIDKKAVRLEYYEGNFVLNLVHDYRAKDLEGLVLPQYVKGCTFSDLSTYLINIKEMKDFADYAERKVYTFGYKKKRETYWNKEKGRRVEKNVIWIMLNKDEDLAEVMDAHNWIIDGITYVHNPESEYYMPVFNPEPDITVYFLYEEGEE